MPPNNLPESRRVEDLLKEYDLQPAEPKTFSAEEIPTSAKRPVVASFITKALIWLFVGQMALITIAYVVTIIITSGNASVQSQTTQALLESVKTIIPVTTTLLGVVIGFYFREETAQENRVPEG